MASHAVEECYATQVEYFRAGQKRLDWTTGNTLCSDGMNQLGSGLPPSLKFGSKVVVYCSNNVGPSEDEDYL